MAASFPTSIKSFTTKIASDVIQPAHVNDLQDEVVALETAALTPAGWTPTITSSGGGAATYTVQVGRYLKIGKAVSISGKVTMATKGTLAAGTVSISGLPVAAANVTNADSAAVIGNYSGMTTAVVSIFGVIQPNTSTIALTINTAAATSTTNCQVSDISTTLSLSFAAQYIAV